MYLLLPYIFLSNREVVVSYEVYVKVFPSLKFCNLKYSLKFYSLSSSSQSCCHNTNYDEGFTLVT